MVHGIRFNLNDNLYLRDPQGTEFGQRLLNYSIHLFNEIGFESFTFKKLALKMDSAEASIYRYFENKHLLLLYLNCWYWEWVHFLIKINTRNIEDPRKKLENVIHTIVYASEESPLAEYIDVNVLRRVIINEGSKSYHIREVDEENQKGFFLSYKYLAESVSVIIREVNPNFKYGRSLASNLFEMANNQIFFAEHLPRLTDIKNKEDIFRELKIMMTYFCFKLVSP